MMEAIAQDRGLTRDQLADRIVPDLGLDERGSRVLDYGPRQFRLVFGPNLKPRLRDEQGAPIVLVRSPSGADGFAGLRGESSR